MHKSEMTRRLANAVREEAPAALPAILAACVTRPAGHKNGDTIPAAREEVVPAKQSRRYYFNKKLWMGLAATLVFLFGGAYFTLAQYGVSTVIEIDVNPGVEIRTNRSEKVLFAVGQNARGESLVADLQLEGLPLTQALEKLMTSLLDQDYVNQTANSVLITVESGGSRSGTQLQQRLSQAVNRLLEAFHIDGAVLSQTLEKDGALQKLAAQYGITLGKAALVRQLTQKDTRYSFAELASLSIHELHLLARGIQADLNGILSSGMPSSEGYIGQEQVKQIALNQAKQKEAAVSNFSCHMDWADGSMVYTVEFRAGGLCHELNLDAVSGEVLEYSCAQDDKRETTTHHADGSTQTTDRQSTDIPATQSHPQTQHHTEQSHTLPHQTEQSRHSETQKQNHHTSRRNTTTSSAAAPSTAPTTATTAAVLIGEARAKQIALERAGLGSAFSGEVEVDLERKKGRQIYEVEFEQANIEYTCIIDAVTGHILEWEEDN